MSLNSVVIIARNGLHLTRRTLKSALAQDVPVEVLLVDNASSDGTMQWGMAIATQHQNVTYTRVNEQKSLAACWNLALKDVWRRGGEHALVLNNDVVVYEGTYRMLLEHGGEFVTTVSVDKEDQFVVNESDFYKRVGEDEYRFEFGAVDRPHPNFSGFLICKSCFDKVGPFNEAYYPAYCEDAEYHIRMHRAGIRAVCIDLPMLHIGNGANTLRFADPADANLIKRGADRNRDRFLETYGCRPGEPEYEQLFSEATFGIDRGVA